MTMFQEWSDGGPEKDTKKGLEAGRLVQAGTMQSGKQVQERISRTGWSAVSAAEDCWRSSKLQSSSSDCCEKSPIARAGEVMRIGYACKILMAKGKRDRMGTRGKQSCWERWACWQACHNSWGRRNECTGARHWMELGPRVVLLKIKPQHHLEICLKCRFSNISVCFTPDILNQKLWDWNPAICILTDFLRILIYTQVCKSLHLEERERSDFILHTGWEVILFERMSDPTSFVRRGERKDEEGKDGIN